MILFHPQRSTFNHLDPNSAALMQKSVAFFENKGLAQIKHDDRERLWYADILEFFKQEQAFATLLTPAGYGAEDARWDTSRICAFNEILGFYSTSYWYTWQVSILGLGPIWISQNEAVKKQTAQFLQGGGHLCFWCLRKRTWSRPLRQRYDPQTRRKGSLPCQWQQVLYWQRQSGSVCLHLWQTPQNERIRR